MSTPSREDEHSEFTPLNQLRRPSHSFLDTPIGSFKGPNSLQNFANSFTRAQSFAASKLDNDITKKRSFFTTSPDTMEDDITFDPELVIPASRGERLSSVIHDISMRNHMLMGNGYGSYGSGSPPTNNDVFYHDDVLSALQSRTRHNSIYTQSGGSNAPIPAKKTHPSHSFSSVRTSLSLMTTPSQFNIKQIEDKEGNIVTVLEGRSTAPQTIFNSVNVLIGVGLLALPVGILRAGWAIGIPYLMICGLATCWSAGLISKAMDTDETIMTYSDLGYAAYGSVAKFVISLIFSIDLMGAGVSLVVLFSDSLYVLLGDDDFWTTTRFKVLAFFVLTPFTFLPLPILSLFSLLGILATISITILVFICGFFKSTSPGSLIQIMPVNMWPQSLPNLLLSIGIVLAPFGGHAIFPSLKSDMRHPKKFSETLKVTFGITLLTDTTMGLVGFLMFGAYCNNEITNNVLLTPGYPKWIYPLISGLICLIPLAKTSLNAKPIIAAVDTLTGVDTTSDIRLINFLKSIGQFINKIFVNALFVLLAIAFPDFDRIIGMLGASICFLVCIILPCLFYLKLCGEQIGTSERILVSFAITISFVLGAVGTWAIISV